MISGFYAVIDLQRIVGRITPCAKFDFDSAQGFVAGAAHIHIVYGYDAVYDCAAKLSIGFTGKPLYFIHFGGAVEPRAMSLTGRTVVSGGIGRAVIRLIVRGF